MLGAWGDTSRADEALASLAAWLGANDASVASGPMHFETRAIHEGQEPDRATGAITTPIYQTSTYVQDAVGVHKGYDYARVGNPTRTALQECLASLEGATHGRAFSSGLGAATTLMHLLSPGDHVVAVNDVYGGIYRMFTQVYEPKGYRFTFLTPEEISTGLAEHLDERTKLVWLETPTNPALNIVDIAPRRRRRTPSARSSSSTTRSRRPTSSSRSRSAPTSRSTRRRSTSAATRTSSAASSRRTTTRSRSSSRSCRSRSAPCRGRSTRGSCCAA